MIKNKKIVVLEDVDELCDIVYRKTIMEFTFFSSEIDKVVEEKNESKSVITYIFNRLMSYKIIQLNDLRKSYYKLLNYVRTFNIELANKYENLFKEYIDKVGVESHE